MQFEVTIELGECAAFLLVLLGIVGEGSFCLGDLISAAALGVLTDDEIADLSRLFHLLIITILRKFKSKHHPTPSFETLLPFGKCVVLQSDDDKWNYHLIPKTFSHKLTNPFSSTLSGMPAPSTCYH